MFLKNIGFLLQIGLVTLALAVITASEVEAHNQKHLNSQTVDNNTVLEEESWKKYGKEVTKEEKQGTDKYIENEEKMRQQKENVSNHVKEYQYNEQSVLEKEDKELQLREEKNLKTKHSDKREHLNMDTNPKQDESEVSELHDDVEKRYKEEEDGQLKAKTQTNEAGGPIQEVKKPGSQEKQPDEQEAQNNGHENSEQSQHVGRLSEGYRVTEPERDEEHRAETQSGFNYLLSHHEDGTGHNLQHAFKSFQDTSLSEHYGVQAHTLTHKGPVPQHLPVNIPEGRHIPHVAAHPVEKTALYPSKQHVTHPVTVHATLHTPVPYTLYKPVPYPVKVPVARPYFFHLPVEKQVPFPVHVRVPAPQSYTVHVPKQYALLVDKQVPAPYPIRLEAPVSQPYPVNVEVPVPAHRPQPQPLKVPVDGSIPVPVETSYPVTVGKEVHYPVEKNVPYAVKVRSIEEENYIVGNNQKLKRGENNCYKKGYNWAALTDTDV